MQAQNRRTFLKTTSTALAAGSFVGLNPSALGANERIVLALIGGNNQGRGVALNAIKDGAEIKTFCDLDDAVLGRTGADLAKAQGKDPAPEKDFRRVLEDKDIQGVIIATPDHWHAIPTILACQAGKDVYVEKPLATTIDEGRAMLTASHKHNRIVQMGSQWKSCTHILEAADFVKSGKLGSVSMVRAWAWLDWQPQLESHQDGNPPPGVDYDFWLGPAPKRAFNPNRFHYNFRWFWDYAGGLMTDWGVLLINLAMWGMGPEHPKTITSCGGKFAVDDNTETPDTQIAVYEFPTYTYIW